MTSTQEPRILLGIDFGTTFTGMSKSSIKLMKFLISEKIGLAYAQQQDEESKPTLDNLEVVTNWLGKEGPKVPSAISYSPTSGGCKQWGYSIDDNSTVLRWTKLELRPRSTVKELSVLRELVKGLKLVQELEEQDDLDEGIPMHVTKNAKAVVRDYISHVGRHWHKSMGAEGKFALDEVHLDIVITHPAV